MIGDTMWRAMQTTRQKTTRRENIKELLESYAKYKSDLYDAKTMTSTIS